MNRRDALTRRSGVKELTCGCVVYIQRAEPDRDYCVRKWYRQCRQAPVYQQGDSSCEFRLKIDRHLVANVHPSVVFEQLGSRVLLCRHEFRSERHCPPGYAFAPWVLVEQPRGRRNKGRTRARLLCDIDGRLWSVTTLNMRGEEIEIEVTDLGIEDLWFDPGSRSLREGDPDLDE